MQETEKQYHIQCKEGDVGRCVLLPGDPGRCESIAKYFDDPVQIGMNREFYVWKSPCAAFRCACTGGLCSGSVCSQRLSAGK